MIIRKDRITTISDQPGQLEMRSEMMYQLKEPNNMDNNNINVRNLCAFIDRKDALAQALKFLTRTSTSGYNHQACTCIICDSFIIGTKKIYVC